MRLTSFWVLIWIHQAKKHPGITPEVQLDLYLGCKIWKSNSSPHCSRVVVVVIVNYSINIRTYLVPRTSLDPSSRGASRNVSRGPAPGMSLEVQLDCSLGSKVWKSNSSPHCSRIVVVVIINYSINIRTYLVMRTSLDRPSVGASRNHSGGKLDFCLGCKVWESNSSPHCSTIFVVVILNYSIKN